MEKYKSFVIQNLDTVANLETSLRTLLFFLPGRVRDSEIKLELAYTVTGLIQLLDESIALDHFESRIKNELMDDSQLLKIQCPPTKIKNDAKGLAFLQHVELLSEMFCKQKWGEKGKWTSAVIIELLRAFLKIKILFKINGKLFLRDLYCQVPQIREYTQLFKSSNPSNINQEKIPSLVSPARWKKFKALAQPKSNNSVSQRSILPPNYLAELAHIIRPLIYLLSMFMFGKKSWKAFVISFVVEFYSFTRYLSVIPKANELERDELLRRFTLFLFYMIRSPFFEKITENRVAFALKSGFKSLPFMGSISELIGEYIGAYRDHYSYISASQ